MTRNSLFAILIAALAIFLIWNSNRADGLSDLAVLPQNIELPESIEEIATPEQALVQVDPKVLDCLQRNIYFEAGDQSIEGKEAVALVVFKRTQVNNTNTFKKDVCGVVYQRKQFSWTWLTNHIPKLHNKLEQQAWDESREVALRALRGEIPDTLQDATHYYSKAVMKKPPYWVTANNRMVYVKTIDDHVFYRDSKFTFEKV